MMIHGPGMQAEVMAFILSAVPNSSLYPLGDYP